MIVLNLKTYQASFEKALLFTDIAGEVASETGVRIVICPPLAYLHEAAERYSDVFSQHVDANGPGAYTGSVPAALLKTAHVKGSLVNHSEKRISNIGETVESLHIAGLESIVCAATAKEAVSCADYSPGGIAIEPPDLIGGSVSVSEADPNIIINSVKAVKQVNNKTIVLCGAGIGKKEDVQKAIELGAEGILIASAFVKAGDHKAFLTDLASVF
ncbi:triose-phosphate isomerase [Candidatus Micrarchaeota archaeon]|nr:triose-phosphate isomerase [Candidatus Micrarchaeota archaeon]